MTSCTKNFNTRNYVRVAKNKFHSVFEPYKLLLHVLHEKSCTIYDKKPKNIVELVIQERVTEKKVVKWANKIVLKACEKMSMSYISKYLTINSDMRINGGSWQNFSRWVFNCPI